MMSGYIARVRVRYGYLELLIFWIRCGLDTLTKFIEKYVEYYLKKGIDHSSLMYNYNGHNFHNIF